jgi:drug/metabolite transporter (DMT)-like permease
MNWFYAMQWDTLVSTVDAIARVCAFALVIRTLCVTNRMSWRKWSWFTLPVFGVMLTCGYIFFIGSEHKEISYPLAIASITAVCMMDKRRSRARMNRGLTKT